MNCNKIFKFSLSNLIIILILVFITSDLRRQNALKQEKTVSKDLKKELNSNINKK